MNMIMIGVYIKQFDEMTYDDNDDVHSASITIYVRDAFK